MISADNKNMQETGETLFTLNGNDRILYLCAAPDMGRCKIEHSGTADRDYGIKIIK